MATCLRYHSSLKTRSSEEKGGSTDYRIHSTPACTDQKPKHPRKSVAHGALSQRDAQSKGEAIVMSDEERWFIVPQVQDSFTPRHRRRYPTKQLATDARRGGKDDHNGDSRTPV